MKYFTVLTYNCRGLNNHFKRRKLFLWLKQQKCDVILLQETYCTEKLVPFLKSTWKGTASLHVVVADILSSPRMFT